MRIFKCWIPLSLWLTKNYKAFSTICLFANIGSDIHIIAESSFFNGILKKLMMHSLLNQVCLIYLCSLGNYKK